MPLYLACVIVLCGIYFKSIVTPEINCNCKNLLLHSKKFTYNSMGVLFILSTLSKWLEKVKIKTYVSAVPFLIRLNFFHKDLKKLSNSNM